MRLTQPKFWETKNFISFILYPLSAITYLINITKKLSNKKKFKIKTICIGNIFVGGSIIKHGGQNPLEPARLGNYIINGPNIKNFQEIYTFLNNIKMSSSTSNILKMENTILKKLKGKTNNKNIKKIIKIGNNILKKNLFYINKYLV